MTANFRLGVNTHVADFRWVNDERVLISIAEKFGALDQPQLTGELYAINANGSGADLLVGARVQGAGLGTKIQRKKVEIVAAALVDDLPHDDRNVLISIAPFNNDPYTRADRMDVYSGRRSTVAQAPVRNASFVTDTAGVVRFAHGSGTDLVGKTYYRDGDGKAWTLLNDEAVTGHDEFPLGFADDGRTAYVLTEMAAGPDAIVAIDITTKTRSEALRDPRADPAEIVYRNSSNIPVGAIYRDGVPHSRFIDETSADARLQHSLEAAFEGQATEITSQTADGKLALVQVDSDRNPGDFYLFDTVAKKADHLLARRDWFDPEAMAPKRAIVVTARDGLKLGGYLTVPKGSSGKNLPMVVLPHGGPFGVADVWAFDDEPQMLAAAGYAVLQINFRGSGGYGRTFTRAGMRQWGGAMQDDVTDATRWAISEGIADSARICIYGASYGAYAALMGAYAALMGAAREPDLYACAAGYAGVYDLPTMHVDGDIQRRGSGVSYLKEWIGERDALAAVSPSRMAEKIKVPVFLAAGGEDQRAPIAHSKMMERALIAAGHPVETLYYPTEGHGFYQPEHRMAYYRKLLAFLHASLGGGVAEEDAKVAATE